MSGTLTEESHLPLRVQHKQRCYAQRRQDKSL